MTKALFAILVDGEVDVEFWIEAEFARRDNGPEDDADWKLTKAECFRLIVSPYLASAEIVYMEEQYEDGVADYTAWLDSRIRNDRNGNPKVYKLTELRHMTRPTFVKDTAPRGLFTLLDSIHERVTQADPADNADRYLDRLKTVGSFG